MVSHTQKRHLILLNDVVLVASIGTKGMNFSGEKYIIHQVLSLECMSIADSCKLRPEEDNTAFEILTPERPYQFLAESESDKAIWLEELEAAIFCIVANQEYKVLGWQHRIVMGTVYSAAVLGETELLKRLLMDVSSGAIDQPDESGMTALHWASLFGNFDCVSLLVESGSDIEYLNSGLNSPLLLASSHGHYEVARYLVIHGANIFVRNLKDCNCLFMAVLYSTRSSGLLDLIKLFSDGGVDLNGKDSSGAMPLHECAIRNLTRPVQILVDCGANVNAVHGRNGLTPLHLACASRNADVETIRSFLDKGALPNWKDTMKRNAFDVALHALQVFWLDRCL